MSDPSSVKFIRLYYMVDRCKLLAEFVRKVAYEKRLSYRDIANASGGQISHGTVSDIINCRSKAIKTDTLYALAKGLGITEDEILDAYRGKSKINETDLKDEEVAALFYDYQALSDDDKRDLRTTLEMIRAEVKRRRQLVSTKIRKGK